MKESTDITIVLDRSGSMQGVKKPTIAAVNEFIVGQQAVPGEALFSLAMFDAPVGATNDGIYMLDWQQAGVPLPQARLLDEQTYVPRGNTPLYRAVCDVIDQTGARLAALPENERPNKVVIVVQTDGMENASGSDYPASLVHQKISDQTGKYNWQFVFLGANIDAQKVGRAMGITGQNITGYNSTSVGTRTVVASVGENLRSYRGGQSVSMGFTDQQRKENAAAK